MLMTEFNLEDCIAVQREEEREEIALTMKEYGEPFEKIQTFTGLSLETIQALKKE